MLIFVFRKTQSMIRNLLIALIFSLLSGTVHAQLREIPKTVREAFSNQYPKASQIDYEDVLTGVHVHFVSDSANMIAKYNNKGAWKETEKQWSFDQLPADVKDGFKKSKYSEWKVSKTDIIYLPGGSEQYRLKAEKTDLQKRYLFLTKDGRLLRETITL